MSKIKLPARRQVKHLTLLREPRNISPKEFNALSRDERLTMVQAMRGRKKYDLLIEAKDAAQLVRRMPIQELYMLAKELGAEDMSDLLAMTTPKQMTGFFDLDCWDGYLLNSQESLRWLTILAQAGEEQVCKVLVGMDFELLVLMVKKWIDIKHGPEDLTDDDVRAEGYNWTGGYVIEYPDDDTAKLVGGLIDILYRLAQPFFRELLEGVRRDTETALEEDVYHGRNGRLLDMGFPDPLEAQAIYAWFNPDNFDPADYRRTASLDYSDDLQAPGFVLTETIPKNLLAEVLAGGLSSETAWELTYLLNKLMMADRVDVGSADQVEQVLKRLYATLNLALEHLCGQDVEKAVELVETCYLEYLFRLGYCLTLQLQGQARVILKSSIRPYVDPPYLAMVQALCLRRPECWEGVVEMNRGGTRPFGQIAELHTTREWLDRLEIQRRLFEEIFPFELPAPEDLDLEGCQIDEADQVSLSTFFLTALANQLLGGEFIPEPLAAVELPTLHGLVSHEGKINPELRRQTMARLEEQLPGGGAFADWCLSVWNDEFCNLSPDHIDARFVGGVLVRLV